VSAPLASYGNGQQSGLSGAHPTCGNSVIETGPLVITAKYGWLQLPVSSGRPSKSAVTRVPVGVATSSITLPVMVEKLMVEVAKVEGAVELPRNILLARLEGAHPTKLGAVSLTLVHSCWLNSIASAPYQPLKSKLGYIDILACSSELH
jgi:hypothetical protein